MINKMQPTIFSLCFILFMGCIGVTGQASASLVEFYSYTRDKLGVDRDDF